MIKVVNLVSLLVAPLIMSVHAAGGVARTIAIAVAAVLLVALIVAIFVSKREPPDILHGAMVVSKPIECAPEKEE
jgi:hypothetical protein